MGRAIVALIVSVVAGVGLTVVVAWWCAACSVVGPAEFRPGRWPAPVPAGWSPWAEMLYVQRGLGVMASWGCGVPPPPRERSGIATQAALVAGWPRGALCSQRRMELGPMASGVRTAPVVTSATPGPLDRPATWREGLALPAPGARSWVQPGRCLPTEVMWRGFLINTGWYSAAVWAALVVPRGVRGRVRRWRGRCVGCGYPVGASESCTECGARVRGAGASHRSG